MKVKGSLAEDIKTTQLRWFGHVRRMMEDRLPKKIYEWQPTGRRKRGRPNITWTEGLLKTMRERGLQEGDWEDREDWRLVSGRQRKTSWYRKYNNNFKIEETTKNLNQVGRPWDLNPGPPKCESRALPRSHLAQLIIIIIIIFIYSQVWQYIRHLPVPILRIYSHVPFLSILPVSLL